MVIEAHSEKKQKQEYSSHRNKTSNHVNIYVANIKSKCSTKFILIHTDTDVYADIETCTCSNLCTLVAGVYVALEENIYERPLENSNSKSNQCK